MSIISSLVVCLLCLIPLSTSTGRVIGVVNKLPQSTTSQNTIESPSIKPSQENTTLRDEHKINSTRDKNTKPKISNNQLHQHNHNHNHHHHYDNEVKKLIPYMRWPRGSKLIKSKAVSWRVPRKKRVPQPGFNLDYDPPKVHPPTHN